jgi:hypothetical protein
MAYYTLAYIGRLLRMQAQHDCSRASTRRESESSRHDMVPAEVERQVQGTKGVQGA